MTPTFTYQLVQSAEGTFDREGLLVLSLQRHCGDHPHRCSLSPDLRN